MRHPKAEQWEARLKAVFDRIDAELEEEYSERYPLRPGRPEPGGTADPEQDGLFNVGAAFSPGYGSREGAGYIVRVDLATLQRVHEADHGRILERVVERLRTTLPEAFPGRRLDVTRDGPVFKIHGDLSLC